jgi:FecR protein
MSRFPLSSSLVLFAAVLSIAVSASAQTAPATPSEHLKAVITAVDGNLTQVKLSEKDAWQAAKVGMELNEEAQLRTGPRGAIQFKIPPDQTISIDRLTTVKLLQAVNDNGKIKTNVGMTYGRTRYDIEAAGREHESTITSPSSTLAIRGTKVSVTDQRPFAAEAVSLTGRAQFRDFKKTRFFGKKNGGTARINTQSNSAAAVAMGHTVVDPTIALARTQAEDQLVQTLLSSGATVSYDYEKGIRIVKGGTVPTTDAELIPSLPGNLTFVLRWTQNTDLNLVVITPGQGTQNRTLYPLGGFNLLPSGGTMPFDHQGGPNGGIEVCFWPDTFPDGRYRIGAQLISGPNTPASVDVFRNGQRLPIRTGNGTVTTANFTATPIDPNIATGIAVGTVDITGGGQATPSKLPSNKLTVANKPEKSPAKVILAGPFRVTPGPSKR